MEGEPGTFILGKHLAVGPDRMLRVTRFLNIILITIASSAGGKLSAVGAGEWKREAGFSWRAVEVKEGKAGFTRLSSETGVTFINELGTNRYATNQNILNGSGVAI